MNVNRREQVREAVHAYVVLHRKVTNVDIVVALGFSHEDVQAALWDLCTAGRIILVIPAGAQWHTGN